MHSKSRREFINTAIAAGATTLWNSNPIAGLFENAVAGKPTAIKHIPQTHTLFPHDKIWNPIGLYERYALWPNAGDVNSFEAQSPEWTAYYRYKGESTSKSSVTKSGSIGFYQIYICFGSIQVLGEDYQAGDFICNYFDDAEVENLFAAQGTTLIVKRQAVMILPENKKYHKGSVRHEQLKFQSLPFIIPSHDDSGRKFDVNSSFLLGDPFAKISMNMTSVTMFEYFKENTVAPSHYHAAPIWHEFIYIQGGHLTPDGFYAPGDHVASFPGCKEGPWLACMDNKVKYPEQWPIYTDSNSLKRNFEKPWPILFDGKRQGVYGLLFVHYGPFAKFRPLKFSIANWERLGSHEMGPRG